MMRRSICLALSTAALAFLSTGPPTRSQDAIPAQERSAKGSIVDSVEVGVLGTEFHWRFRYPGPDGLLQTPDDVESERVLYLPPRTSVSFRITSRDYVYILGIPVNETGPDAVEKGLALEKKREIAVPGLVHSLEHRYLKEGSHDLMVDPLCGFQSLHDPKMGEIIVSATHNYQNLFPMNPASKPGK